MLGSREEPTTTVSANYCPFSQRICRYWPFKSVQTQNPLAPTLKSIVAAAESKLGTTIKNTAVSAYDIGTIDYGLAKDDIHTALSELGVDSYSRLDHIARQLAPALGIRGNCSEPYTLPNDAGYHKYPEQILLTIEYTLNSMTAGLWKEECGVMEMTNRLNAPELGYNAVQTCREATENSTTCEEIFKSALRSVSADSSREEIDEIDAVLVFGECAEDEDMLIALRQVLEDQFPNGDSVDLSRVRDFSPDPAFAGSRAMAKAAWEAHVYEQEGRSMEEL